MAADAAEAAYSDDGLAHMPFRMFVAVTWLCGAAAAAAAPLGPALIEAGGLGTFKPTAIGPTRVQVPNGVVDILVDSEKAGVAAAKKYLAYFQGPLLPASAHRSNCADQQVLRGYDFSCGVGALPQRVPASYAAPHSRADAPVCLGRAFLGPAALLL